MSRQPNGQSIPGFTIVEVLVVMSIILVLAGLILGTSSYVHNKSARSRAETEIAAMSAALENYKADNGVYPASTTVDARNAISFPDYQIATLVLYKALSATDPDGTPISGARSYFSFKPQMLVLDNVNDPVGPGNLIKGIRDPFGNSYGYSTAGEAGGAAGFNPTFDLWSTDGITSGSPSPQWIKNW